MSRQPRVTVVGSYNTDLMFRTPRMPARGETILGGPFFMGPGGKGANQAVAAARLGADTTMVVKLGQDIFGDQAVANLKKENVRCDFVFRTAEASTGAASIIVDDEGENLIVVAPGANNLLTPEDVEAARAAIARCDVMLIQLEIPMETVRRAVLIAHEAGARVVLNPAPGRALDAGLLDCVDVLTPNEIEAQIISGMPVQCAQDAEPAARKLLANGADAVVVTLGSEGALVATSSAVRSAPGHKVQVLDTTGAGDAFSGALAVALAEGQDLDHAVAFANAAAALQVTRVGAAPAMPYRCELDLFIRDLVS